jgi:hypothetical protein
MGHQTKESTVSIESESQKDLSLNDADAENVVGGFKKKAKKKAVQHAGAGPKYINVQSPVVATEQVPSDECDPDYGADGGTPSTGT